MVALTKDKINNEVDKIEKELLELSHYIHSHPELGNEEFKAKSKIIELLKNYGFTIENVEGIETAFIATYQNENTKESPTIGLLCEYDALEGLGHGCAHNLQAPVVIGAAVSIIKTCKNNNFTIKIFGTPAEETTSAKIPMTHMGLFDELDVALMMHGGDRTTVDGKSLAADSFEFIFEGTASHAAVAPEKGRSALDAVIQAFNGIEFLREHVRSDVRMHGVITNGGLKANIVPEVAVAEFSIRAKDREYLNSVSERVVKVVEGAALSTETSVRINKGKQLESKLNVQILNDVLLKNAKFFEASNITPPRKRTGSTDFSIVTHRVPGACIRVAFVPQGTPNHTKEWTVASASQAGNNAIITGAKILAGTIYDLLSTPSLLEEIKREHNSEKKYQNIKEYGDENEKN